MAFRTWLRVLLAAVGMGLLAGTGQLGLAYGLGLLRFARAFGANGRDEWSAQLTWVVWIAIGTAVLGTLAGSRRARRDGVGTATRVSAALLGGGLAAAAVAPLAMLPARAAVLPGVASAPVAGVCVLLGAAVGVLASVAVLVEQAIRWNVLAVAGGVWLVALVSVATSLGADNALVVIRLGVLEPDWVRADLMSRVAVATMAALALVAGAVVGAVARRRGTPPAAAVVSGLVGPALLAVAYLIAGPGDAGDRFQDPPYWGAFVAVVAGLLGALLAALVHRTDREAAADASSRTPPPTVGAPDRPATTPPSAGDPAGAWSATRTPLGPAAPVGRASPVDAAPPLGWAPPHAATQPRAATQPHAATQPLGWAPPREAATPVGWASPVGPPPGPAPRQASAAAPVHQRRPTPQPYVPVGPLRASRSDPSFGRPAHPPPVEPRTPPPGEPRPPAPWAGRPATDADAAPWAGQPTDADAGDQGGRRSWLRGSAFGRAPRPPADGQPGPESPVAPSQSQRRRGARADHSPDDDYVNWVSGLGGTPDDRLG